jgi:signal transduction histidine kinase
VKLAGDWAFYWNHFLKPDAFAQGHPPLTGYRKVPLYWTKYTGDYHLLLWFSAFILIQSLMLAIRFAQEQRIIEGLTHRRQALDKFQDDFLANTFHELRTPLNGIIGIGESLIAGATGVLPRKTIRTLEMIVSSGRRLASLINDILGYRDTRCAGSSAAPTRSTSCLSWY